MSSSVWVGNLPEGTTQQELKKAFGRFGKVVSCEVKTVGEHLYAFVNFKEMNSAEAALEEEHVLISQGLYVTVAPYRGKGLPPRPSHHPRGHPPTDCTFFLATSCKNGEKCSYRHSEVIHRNRPDVCKEWVSRKCFNWDCPYYHPSQLPGSNEEPAEKGESQTNQISKAKQQKQSSQPPKKSAWGGKAQEGSNPQGTEPILLITGIQYSCSREEAITNTIKKLVDGLQLKADVQEIFSSYRESQVIVTLDRKTANSSLLLSESAEKLQLESDKVSEEETWNVQPQSWTAEKKEQVVSRSNMIECLLSYEYHWAKLEDFASKCLSNYGLVVSEEFIRSRCQGVINVYLDDLSDKSNRVVLFSDLDPLGTFDEQKGELLKKNILNLVKADGKLKLLDIPALYEEKYGTFPVKTIHGSPCVKDVIKSAASLCIQGSRLTEMIVLLRRDNTPALVTTSNTVELQPDNTPSITNPSSPTNSLPPPSNPPPTNNPSPPSNPPPPPSNPPPPTNPLPSTVIPTSQPVSTVSTVTTGVVTAGGMLIQPQAVMPTKAEVKDSKQASEPRIPESTAPRDLVLRLADIQKPLTKDSYRDKFVKLLLWEESEQRQALHMWCECCETILHYKPPTSGESPSERLGWIYMDCDLLAYVKKVADSERVDLVLKEGSRLNGGQLLLLDDVVVRAQLAFDRTRDVNQLAVILNEDITILSDFLTPEGFLEAPVLLKLKMRGDKFLTLRQSVSTLSLSVIRRILPEQNDFPKVYDQPLWEGLEPLTERCTVDQKLALQSLLSVPPNGPPFLLLGAKGTGKTFLLVTALCCFVLEAQDKGYPLRVLVNAQSHALASDFLECFVASASEGCLQELNVVQLVPEQLDPSWSHTGEHLRTVPAFRGDREAVLKHERLVVVSTYETSAQVVDVMPSGFFTHVLLDDCGQIMEPECTIPFHFVGYTRVVMCGDECQVGTDLLLGEEACDNGLQVSLLKRLHTRYERFGIQSSPFEAVLTTEHRSHPDIVQFVGNVFYNIKLEATAPSSTHPDVTFPFVFVCTSVDGCAEEETVTDNSKETEPLLQVVDGSMYRKMVMAGKDKETESLLQMVGKFADTWPGDLWGEKDLSKLCIMTPTWNQLAEVSKQLEENQYPNLKSVCLQPYCDIQSRQYRAVFVTTSESVEVMPDGSVRPSNPTKSICDPSVFNTIITRAQSLVVCVGNPFLLLRLEQSMVKKYGEKGRCWSRYLKACLDHGTLWVHDSRLLSKVRTVLEERINLSGS